MAIFYILVNRMSLTDKMNGEILQFDTLDEARQEAEKWNFWEIVKGDLPAGKSNRIYINFRLVTKKRTD